MKQLNKELLDQITNRLVNEFKPEKVILFGSHAWGNPNENSDIDICVILSSSNDRIVDRIRRADCCLNGIKVSKDVLVKTHKEMEEYREVAASLERKILLEGRVLYAGN
jgi:uncharacterized protein